MNTAIILAGGHGTRMGSTQPKQFIEVRGKPILAYTIEKFQKHANIDAIEIVCVDGYQEYVEQLVTDYGFDKAKYIVKGGNTFQQSVMNGVLGLLDVCSPDDIVLIHYAASPFVSEEIISDAIRVCRQKGNCTSATPLYLLLGQTFRYNYVVDLYKEAAQKDLLDKVEPHTTSLMFALGRPIYFSKGDQSNIKITTKEDLKIFEGYTLLQENSY